MGIDKKKNWRKEVVVYQIYPRSFKDSNGDGIGDLNGIIEKLDYLEYLGIDVIWLSPIYQSPNCDNGYDISDYQEIMKDFGTMDDYDRLLEESHKRGIKIIMDLVVNHTSDEHVWFTRSREKEENKYWDYYIWREGKDGEEPNNWGSWFSGSAWKYDENRKKYYLHIFADKQPDLNWKNPNVREEVFQMMKWWLDKGTDGFRMDVISLISKTDEFPDGIVENGQYGTLNPYCMHGPHVHEYLKEMNEKVLSKYDIITVGEAAGVTTETAKQYAGYEENELDMVFQFEHVELGSGEHGKWSEEPVKLSDLKEIFEKWEKELDGIAWNTLFWSNHDQPRAVSKFGDDEKYWNKSAKMLATCIHMMKGTPYIYQGEEIGMTNAGFDRLEDYRDVESLNAYHELVEQQGVSHDSMMRYLQRAGRDNARTPMQWSSECEAGFTTGTPWIQVNKNYTEINVEKQKKDENSILNYYRKLISLRHELPIIVYGDFALILKEDARIFAYTRVLGEEKLTVLCNFTDEEAACSLVSLEKEFLFQIMKKAWMEYSDHMKPWYMWKHKQLCFYGKNRKTDSK